MTKATARFKHRFWRWFLQGIKRGKEKHAHEAQAAWWKVMCLTGVDYFSTLGYQPGIAFIAAGFLSPLATIILVLLTLFGALPVYWRVSEESPHGQGSIAMLEHLLPGWRGKALVLCLLGFALTDFIITITLSAADAAAHIVQNPLLSPYLHNKMAITLILLAVLGSIFLLGFREAIGVSVFLVFLYLVLNVVVVSFSVTQIMHDQSVIATWQSRLFEQHHSIWLMIGLSMLLFPKLALGLSGFETGVAVMPLVKGKPGDCEESPSGRIANTKYLLATAAVIMSVALIFSSFVTCLLIPPEYFKEGQPADGRALAFLAHKFLGEQFGTLYDLSTIAILWFAGASAMAGMLNLVPRYLPRYGMAPHWASAMRPLVVFFTVISFAVTIYFKANVDAQGGAYATGVLFLITSAAIAVTLTGWQKKLAERHFFLAITIVFVYTTIANIIERPEGMHIAAFFISVIVCTSLTSRAVRSIELRVQEVRLDEEAQKIIEEAGRGVVRIVAHRPGASSYELKEREACQTHNIPQEDIVFLQVNISDASDFEEETLLVKGERIGRYRVLTCQSPAVPNALAALLLHVRNITNSNPNIYFGWTEGNPVYYVMKFLFFGEGETAPITREVLRAAEQDPARRPVVHVG
jgi:hypothetical protein